MLVFSFSYLSCKEKAREGEREGEREREREREREILNAFQKIALVNLIYYSNFKINLFYLIF